MFVGCTGGNHYVSSSESIECQRIERFWKNLESDKIKMIAFYGKDSNEPIEEVTLEEAKEETADSAIENMAKKLDKTEKQEETKPRKNAKGKN
jgi:hypothetical protein